MITTKKSSALIKLPKMHSDSEWTLFGLYSGRVICVKEKVFNQLLLPQTVNLAIYIHSPRHKESIQSNNPPIAATLIMPQPM